MSSCSSQQVITLDSQGEPNQPICETKPCSGYGGDPSADAGGCVDPAPAGNDSIRAGILESARRAFATGGYNGASVRAIAVDAGVDPSTVIHFFATKGGLFQAVIQDVAKASAPLLEALCSPVSSTELVKIYLTIWDDADSGPAMQAIIRTSFGSERAMELFREIQTRSFLEAFTKITRDPIDAELMMMQLIAVGIGRYIAKLPELAGHDIETISDKVGPKLDQYLE